MATTKLAQRPASHGELARWENEIEDLFEDISRRFSFPMLARRRPLLETRGWAPAVDMYERDNEIVMSIELPGMDKKDIHVGISDGILTIEGEHQAEAEANKIKANYHDGVLDVHLPKMKEAQSKKIEVTVQ